MKSIWKKFLRVWRDQPGRRFQDYYRRVRREKNSNELGPRVGRLAASLVLIVIGICLIFLPLIYIPFLVVGGALLAAESLTLAKCLDHGELAVTNAWSHLITRLGLRQSTVRALGVVAGVLSLCLAGYICYRSFTR